MGRAAFNQRVYDNAPPQVGGIAAAREAIQQKAQAVVNNWVVEQPAYQRTFRAVAQYVEPPTPPDPMMLALSALRQVARSASQAPSTQPAGLSDVNLGGVLRELTQLSGVPLPEANVKVKLAQAILGIVVSLLKTTAKTSKKTMSVGRKAVGKSKTYLKRRRHTTAL